MYIFRLDTVRLLARIILRKPLLSSPWEEVVITPAGKDSQP
jgi:hypothetical protein